MSALPNNYRVPIAFISHAFMMMLTQIQHETKTFDYRISLLSPQGIFHRAHSVYYQSSYCVLNIGNNQLLV